MTMFLYVKYQFKQIFALTLVLRQNKKYEINSILTYFNQPRIYKTQNT